MLIRVLDFETTGVPAEGEPHAVCEVGWYDIRDGALIAGGQMFCDPGRPMPVEAQAVHHIRDCELVGKPPPAAAFAALMDGPPDVFVAHHAVFEQAFFDGGGVSWIDTRKVALRLWPDAPAHSNQVLRYFLSLPVDDRLALPPHRAQPDAYVTAHLLLHAIDHAGAEIADMIAWSREPARLVRCGFGKHRGQRWDEVPSDYLRWIMRQDDMDPEVTFTARQQLIQRGEYVLREAG